MPHGYYWGTEEDLPPRRIERSASEIEWNYRHGLGEYQTEIDVESNYVPSEEDIERYVGHIEEAVKDGHITLDLNNNNIDELLKEVARVSLEAGIASEKNSDWKLARYRGESGLVFIHKDRGDRSELHPQIQEHVDQVFARTKPVMT